MAFKQLFSNSVMKYVDEHKMNYAPENAAAGPVNVTDIADELGYSITIISARPLRKDLDILLPAVQC